MPTAKPQGRSLRIALENVLPHTSIDQLLPILRAVEISADETGEITVAATDRYTLATDHLPADADPTFYLLIDRDDVKRLIAALPKKGAGLCSLTLEGNRLHVLTPEGVEVILHGVEDGAFPKWRTLFPSDTRDVEPDGIFHLNPANLAKFAKVQPLDDTVRRDPGSGAYPLRFTFGPSNKPVIVEMGETFRAILMTVRRNFT